MGDNNFARKSRIDFKAQRGQELFQEITDTLPHLVACGDFTFRVRGMGKPEHDYSSARVYLQKCAEVRALPIADKYLFNGKFGFFERQGQPHLFGEVEETNSPEIMGQIETICVQGGRAYEARVVVVNNLGFAYFRDTFLPKLTAAGYVAVDDTFVLANSSRSDVPQVTFLNEGYAGRGRSPFCSLLNSERLPQDDKAKVEDWFITLREKYHKR